MSVGPGKPHRVALLPVRLAANGPSVGDRMAAPGVVPNVNYRAAASLFRCCLIDRTGTLDCGFPYHVFRPFEPDLWLDDGPVPAFAEICDAVADDFTTFGRRLWLLWSGGIDSTVAAVALLSAYRRAERRPHLRVLFSKESAEEYPAFFHQTLVRTPGVTCGRFDGRVSDLLKGMPPGVTLVTGEHGDQLFGSDKLAPLAADGAAFAPYADLFPLIADRTLGRVGAGGELLSWLGPQLEVCPRPLETVFDLYWWLNFSLKWQLVSLRIPVSTGRRDMKRVRSQTCHFFAHPLFQKWAVRTDEPKHGGSWETYKLPAKRYLLDRTGDRAYFETKIKRPSLRGRIAGGPRRVRVVYANEL